MQHILSKGESHDDIPFQRRSLKSLRGCFPSPLPPCAEYPLFTIPSESSFCMMKWTFVRINYHYMGLPFLCMRGSLRITSRLLHIFFQTPLHQICLYLFHSADFGKALSLHWPKASSKTLFLQNMCMRTFFPSYYRYWRLICFFSFKKILSVFSNSPETFLLPHVLYVHMPRTTHN